MSDEPKPTKFTLSLDYRMLCVALLIVIAGMLVTWRPWQSTDSDRTVQVTGEVKLKAEPDEFIFYPSYQFTNTDKTAALKAVSSKSSEVVNKLKELGVPENKIQTSSSGYDEKLYYPSPENGNLTFSLNLIISVNSRENAQKISDYLATTGPTGMVSPQPGFSDSKRKELEQKARDQALDDARLKAEQNAHRVGASLGKVKDIADGQGFGGGPVPLGDSKSSEQRTVTSSSLPVFPGEGEILYTVTVTYFIR